MVNKIEQYILKNNKLEVSVLNLGAVLHKVIYKGKNRVLTYDDLETYRTNPIYLGAIVGQVAGRISNAKFNLNGEEIHIDNNNGDYCLHGGYENLTTRFWDISEYKKDAINPYIILTTVLKDGQSGFPGNVKVNIKYILIESTLRIEIFAHTDKDTIVSITNHSYFNLNAEKSESIKNHKLMINADEIIQSDEHCIATGLMDVKGTDFDLIEGKDLSVLDNLKSEQAIQFDGYDHTFILNGDMPNAKLENDEISMEVTSSYPAMVVYSGNSIPENELSFEGVKSFKHHGICFEAQYEPDFINQDFLPDYTLKAGEEMREFIEYKFL
ncbi:aldose epimerase family protein [Helcococcus kunzii]|uniref:aldose epimerase family protein n=1 Tax=Helcococcus kunzii TaxID=40091 RepID=UPI0038B0A315